MTSIQLLLSFTVTQLRGLRVSKLLVFNDKLLVAQSLQSNLFIYSREGRHLLTIKTKHTFYDTIWSHYGNIVSTTWETKLLIVMSESGQVITTHRQWKNPMQLSMCNDGFIYLSTWEEGLYRSTDEGISWNLFTSMNRWYIFDLIKVAINNSDEFWALTSKNRRKMQIKVHTINKRQVGGHVTFKEGCNITWEDVNTFVTDDKNVSLDYSRLSYDGKMTLFLSETQNKAVHVLSVTGHHHCHLVSSHYVTYNPWALAVDKERQLLYVGQWDGLVEVFKLIYGDWGA